MLTFAANGSITAGGSQSEGGRREARNLTAPTFRLPSISAPEISFSGETTITAGTLDFQFGSYVTIQADDVTIMTSPTDGQAYLSVGSATATLAVGSLSLTGTATDFSIINSGGAAAFDAGDTFSVSFSATATQLHLPSWMQFPNSTALHLLG